MQKAYDLIVIGTGSAATTVATRCRGAGWSVAIVDRLPYGGTCALRGCDPKKVLIGAAEALERARALSGSGVRAGDPRIVWPELQRFKRTFTEPVPAERESMFADAGIHTLHGAARFSGPDTLEVGATRLSARHIVVAAGSRPAPLPIAGGELIATSDRFLDLDELPPSIAFVGGGYVSMELAHVAARAGARVTILHRGDRPLETFDVDLVEQVTARTREIGIDLRVRSGVAAIEARDDGRYDVVTGDPPSRVTAHLVVHGAGRIPDIDDLDLAAGGIVRVKQGITVNDHLQSISNPRVFAAGDCAASSLPRLTPVAAHHGRVVATNLLEGLRATVTREHVPSVVFTLPSPGAGRPHRVRSAGTRQRAREARDDGAVVFVAPRERAAFRLQDDRGCGERRAAGGPRGRPAGRGGD